MRPLHKRLRAARIRKGLRQKDVAEALGVVSNTVARWERGVRNIQRFLRPAVEAWIADPW